MLTDTAPQTGGRELLLQAVGLCRSYTRGGWLSRRQTRLEVLRNVDLKIHSRSTVALIGASGSGKSTLARCLSCLETPESGELWFANRNLFKLSRHQLAPFRRQIQLIFQEPSAALNPRFTAVDLVSEPLLIAGVEKRERRDRALERMELVGLPPSLGSRLPSQLSAGQRRRLAIARALTLEPRLLILDEALTGLDLSTRAQISNLLLKLQEVFSLTYLLISHDFGLVTHLAEEVVVLDKGRIVESGAPEFAEYSRQSCDAPADTLKPSSLAVGCQ